MVVKTVSVAPEYVNFYVTGSDDFGVLVERLNGRAIATPECIVVTCLYWNDDNTTITLGPAAELTAQDMPLRIDTIPETPERRVLISDVHMPAILSTDVPGAQTRVRIQTNHETQPDDVVIALGETSRTQEGPRG